MDKSFWEPYFRPLKEKIKSRKNIDLDVVEKAFYFAADAHREQKRKSGGYYITHPVSVAELIAENNGDEESIIAALLHDVVEDTSIEIEDIESKFGGNIAKIVEGLTKVNKLKYAGVNNMDANLETIRKWMEVMTEDLRVSIIKIFDRVHNLQTLDGFRREKQQRIAQNTLDVYARFAEWLSMGKIKTKLENTVIPYILNQKHLDEISDKKSIYIRNIKEIISRINTEYRKKPLDIYFQLESSIPSLKSFYTSMQQGEKTEYTIYCIVPREEDCYKILSFFHKNWRRKKNSFEDYINTPGIKGHQRIQTSIILDSGESVCVKILTPEMKSFYEEGACKFIFENNNNFRPEWIKKMEQLMKVNPEESYKFWKSVESDLLKGFIFIHGFDTKMQSLPYNSTYLDAAILLLKKKVKNLEYIEVNGKRKSFNERVKDGEKLQFYFSDYETLSHEWIRYIENITNEEFIKNLLREKKLVEKRELGKKLLQDEFDKYNLGLIEEMDEKKIIYKCHGFQISSIDELLLLIGGIYILPSEVIAKIAPEKLYKEKSENQQSSIVCELEKESIPLFFSLLKNKLNKSVTSIKKTKSNIFQINCSLNTSQENINNIIQDIRYSRKIKIKEISPKGWNIITSVGVLTFLSILWGIGLVVADYLLNSKNIEPLLFSTSRLWTVAALMGAIYIFFPSSQSFSKSLNTKHISFYGSLLSFTGIPLFTYLSLQYSTPSEYVLFMLTHSVLFLFVLLIQKKNINWKYIIPIIVLLGIGYFIFLVINPHFSNIGILYTFLSVLSFGGYTYSSEYYIKNLAVKARYPKFLFMISSIGALICTILYIIFVGIFPSWDDILYTSIYSICFSGVAYTLYYIFIHKSSYTSLVGYSFIMFLIVTYIGQLAFLDSPIYLNEFFAIPFLFGAVALGSKYKRLITN
jgi:guanosine-3',5'-bis(diphosphate) 3'-pyrophosphohydrolase